MSFLYNRKTKRGRKALGSLAIAESSLVTKPTTTTNTFKSVDSKVGVLSPSNTGMLSVMPTVLEPVKIPTNPYKTTETAAVLPSLQTAIASQMPSASKSAETAYTPLITGGVAQQMTNMTPQAQYTGVPLIVATPPSYPAGSYTQPTLNVVPLNVVQPTLVPWIDNTRGGGAGVRSGGGGGSFDYGGGRAALPTDDPFPTVEASPSTVYVQNKIPWWVYVLGAGLIAKWKGWI